ncbi:MAG: hypothetical protein ABIR26_00125 [Ramlibacter sp.]
MSVMRELLPHLLPELGQFPPPEWADAIKKAHEIDLSIGELIGAAFGLVLLTTAVQYALMDPPLSPWLAALLGLPPSWFVAFRLNFIFAVPLIILLAVPMHIRRLRRELRKQLKLRERGHE